MNTIQSDENEIIIKEQCGSVGDIHLYYGKSGQNIKIKKSTNPYTKVFKSIFGFFREVLLPYGYPDSVSEDYFSYQIWDTLQAFCSTITGAFTTRAILKGVGVGDAQASALSATITWIMKDGTGLIGRIIFAWWKGNGLDTDCKKWRLFADFLNDSAMLIELSLPYFTNFSMQLLCVTTGMKSIVGIAGGATRASITHHQAIKDNMAEISAKDGSQETLVNLVASFVSIALLNVFTDDVKGYTFILMVMLIHLLTNYMAVKSLIFKNFNDARIIIILKTYLNMGTILGPQSVNQKETVVLGFGVKAKSICGFKISMGNPLKSVLHKYNVHNVKATLKHYEDKKYFLICDLNSNTVHVCFENGETAEDVIKAYFHSMLLAKATCIYNNLEMENQIKRQLHQSTPMSRLYTFMKSYKKEPNEAPTDIPENILESFNSFVQQEIDMFFTALQIKDWNLESHSLNLGQWRYQWKDLNKKQL